MRSLLIALCSAQKRGDDVGDPARAADGSTELTEVLADAERRQQAEARLAEYACPAMDLYTGTHHQLLMAGVRAVWQRWGREVLDLAILSGGYGLLPAEQVVIPYDVTFDEFDASELAAWVARLEIPQRAAALVGAHDLVFYLLDGRYLQVLGLPLDVPGSVQQIVLTDEESLPRLPPMPNLHAFVAHGPAAARRWHVKSPHVRAFLFGRLCQQIVHHGPTLLDWLYRRPQDIEELFYKHAQWRPQWPLL